MKIKNRSRKRRHKRDGIGVRRIRTFSFLPTPLTTPSLTFRLWSSENQIVGVGSRSRRTKPITKRGNVHCDWLILPLLLPTPTIWFSLNHKRNVSDGVVSGIGTLLDYKLFKILITTPTQTPSLVKTNLLMTRVVYHFQGQSGRFTVWANCKQNSGCYFCPGIGLAICTNQFHLRKNGRENLKTESFGTFRPVKQDYLLRYSITPANFPLGRPRKSCSIYFPTGFSNQDHTESSPVRGMY